MGLYRVGDPVLDIGNFIAYFTGHGLRILGHPNGYPTPEEAFADTACPFNLALGSDAI